MTGFWSIIAGTAALPVGWALGAFHSWRCGPSAIIDVRVKRSEEAIDRQALLLGLRRMASDPNVAGVLLRLQAPPGGFAACQDLRGAIGTVRRSGKPVYAFVEAPGNAVMWIAAACDRVFCVPTGEVGLVGLGVELTFFGAALSRLGVTPDFEAAGAYKSFGETWTRSFPSAENQEAVSGLIESLQRQMIEDIAADRKLEVAQVEAAIAEAPLPAEAAVERGLLDQLKYEDELLSWLEEHHGEQSTRVEYAVWSRRDQWIEAVEQWGEGNTIVAVLHFDGPIVMEGSGNGSRVQARKVVPILRKLRENEQVAAVVLHVNSPGGSALASDLMWREVDALRQDKPVVACFEDVAASGGFYLAAPAAEILARPGTITGSIGVFGGKLVAGEGMRSVGVHTHEVAAAPNATLYSPQKRFTDGQRVRFKASLQRFYDGFVQRVADGRRASVEAIEPHCRGRVWTGDDARSHGLVDRFGDLHDAVDRARALAGLHHGGFVRHDLTGEPRSWVQKQIREAIRKNSPVGARALAGMWLPAGARWMVELAFGHPGEPLAVLPVDVRVE